MSLVVRQAILLKQISILFLKWTSTELIRSLGYGIKIHVNNYILNLNTLQIL